MHSWLYMIGIRLSKCSSPLFLLLFILSFPLAHLLSQSGPPSLRAGLARDLACPLLSRGAGAPSKGAGGPAQAGRLAEDQRVCRTAGWRSRLSRSPLGRARRCSSLSSAQSC